MKYSTNIAAIWVLATLGAGYAHAQPLAGQPLVAQPLDLREVIQAVIATHPAVQSQARLVESAQADVSTARQQFYPTPSVTLEQVAASGADSAYKGNATLQTYRVQQPLWTGGRLTASLEKAQAHEQAAQASRADAAQQLSLRAVQVWGEWHAATLKLAAIDESLQTHQRLALQVRRRVGEGAAAPADLVLTEGRLAQTVATQQAMASQVRAARLKLAQLTGTPVGDAAVPRESLELPVQDVASLTAQALAASPVLRRLEVQQQAQEAEVRERKAELLPEVYVRLEHQRSGYSSAAMPSGGGTRVFVGLSSRLGAGLSNLTQLESLNKRRESAQADAEAARRTLSEQIETDHELWASLTQRLPELERALQATRKTAEAWDRQFLAGRKSWMEVMNTARELMQAELELVDARASLVGAKWRLSILGHGVERTLDADALAAARATR